MRYFFLSFLHRPRNASHTNPFFFTVWEGVGGGCGVGSAVWARGGGWACAAIPYGTDMIAIMMLRYCSVDICMG